MQKGHDRYRQSPSTTTLHDVAGNTRSGITIASWRDWDRIAQKEHANEMQRLVDNIFREQVMGCLALLLVPILLLLDFAKLSGPIFTFLTLIDIAIWVFFVLEYICRLTVAKDHFAYMIAPWHIIDLLIIGIPAVALLSGTGYGIARYFRVLRAMQAVQVLYIAGKQAHRHFAEMNRESGKKDKTPPMRVRSVPVTSPGIANPAPASPPSWVPVIIDESANLDFRGHWVDFSCYTSSDLPTFSRLTGIPEYLLEVKLRERAYPRADISGHVKTVFLKLPSVHQEQSEPPVWKITWEGLLIAYNNEGVLTFSRSETDVPDRMLAETISRGIELNGPGILFLIVNDSLSTIEDLILMAEEQLIYLETQSMNSLPRNFLSMMYTDQKELSRITAGLLHTKTALEEVSENDREGSGGDDTGDGRIQSLIDRCSLLSDSAQHVSDSFAWMVDFYLNTTSFSMNRVMKILAVLTALTMVPTLVGGLLGMNLIDNPWPVTLLQMISVVALVMLVTAWVYYNLGWLREQ
jgi:Mg2+ and Co2+ transporter CorA